MFVCARARVVRIVNKGVVVSSPSFLHCFEFVYSATIMLENKYRRCCAGASSRVVCLNLIIISSFTWTLINYLKYLIRERSCAVGLCLVSLLSNLTAASCRGIGTRGNRLCTWSSSCNTHSAMLQIISLRWNLSTNEDQWLKRKRGDSDGTLILSIW